MKQTSCTAGEQGEFEQSTLMILERWMRSLVSGFSDGDSDVTRTNNFWLGALSFVTVAGGVLCEHLDSRSILEIIVHGNSADYLTCPISGIALP